MIAQRAAGAAPASRAWRSDPARTPSVDAAMAVITDHHWASQGVASPRCMRDRAPARRRADASTSSPRRRVLAHAGLPARSTPRCDADRLPGCTSWQCEAAQTIRPVPVPHDCIDGLGLAFWRRPEAYLDPEVRAGISFFHQLDSEARRARDGAARGDLASGAWAERNATCSSSRSSISGSGWSSGRAMPPNAREHRAPACRPSRRGTPGGRARPRYRRSRASGAGSERSTCSSACIANVRARSSQRSSPVGREGRGRRNRCRPCRDRARRPCGAGLPPRRAHPQREELVGLVAMRKRREARDEAGRAVTPLDADREVCRPERIGGRGPVHEASLVERERRSGLQRGRLQVREPLIAEQSCPAEQRVDVGGEPVARRRYSGSAARGGTGSRGGSRTPGRYGTVPAARRRMSSQSSLQRSSPVCS